MNDRDLEIRLRAVYRAEAAQADPGALIERVHVIPTTAGPARPQWWHRFWFGASRSAASDGIHVRGAHNMFAASGITAAVAALIIGGSFLAAQLEDQPAGGAQPAGATGESWVSVTGQQDLYCANTACSGTYHDMSDPRLDGKATITFAVGQEPESEVSGNVTLWGEVDVANEGGTWEGNWVGFADDKGLHHVTAWFEGTGEYEGLRYIEQAYEPEGGLSITSAGLLFDGDIPATVIPPVIPDDAVE